MTRQQRVLREPRNVDGLPSWPSHGQSSPPLYRVCANEYDQPWWFSARDVAADPGRYDLEYPLGTCHWSDEPVGALLERLVDPDALDPIVEAGDLDLFRIWTLGLTAAGPVADLTVTASRAPKELSTMTPYDRIPGPWQWADAVATGGWDGLVGWTRMDSGPSRTIALFGPAGATSAPASCTGKASVRTSARDHEAALGAWVSGAPSSADLEVLDP